MPTGQASKSQRCEFWPEDSKCICEEPGAYKLTWVDYAPYTHIVAQWLCKEHYELMADIVRTKANDEDSRDRHRAERMMELNNWFQHE